MAVKEYLDGDVVLVRHITAEEWDKKGLNFYSKDEEFIQVGSWNYDNGKELLKHKHNIIEKPSNLTQETLYIRQGSIKAHVYNTKNEFIEEIIAHEGDVLIMLHGGHGYDILSDDTQVLEIKNGPYVGADADRIRF